MSYNYLTLPSNSSMRVFPTNTMTTYKTLLPVSMNLGEPHECALSEITFPTTWYNLRPDMMYVMLGTHPQFDAIRTMKRFRANLSRKSPKRKTISSGSRPETKRGYDGLPYRKV